MLPNLADLLKYNNKNILTRYQKDYPEAKMSAAEALQELMKYIWICLKHSTDSAQNPHEASLQFTCVMHDEMIEIDYMWHTFLLFTRDYDSFCRTYLGEFFHHQPLIKEDDSGKANYAVELERYLSYIFDNLGEDTLKKWFDSSLY